MTTSTGRESVPRRLLLAILFLPRRTIRQLVATNPEYLVYSLAILESGVQVVRYGVGGPLGDLPLPVILLVAVVVAPVSGLLSLFIAGELLRWIGGRFGGQASGEEVRAAVAWSSVPSILGSLVGILGLLVAGQESDAVLGWYPVELLLITWAFVLLVRCIEEVHRFSLWRASVTTALAGLVLSLPRLCLFVVDILLNRAFYGRLI